MKIMPFAAVAAALLLALQAGVSAQPKPKALWDRNEPLPKGFNQGDAFPSIVLPSAADGTPVSIADFRGKKVIVNVFASW